MQGPDQLCVEKRTVHAIRVMLRFDPICHVIVWPSDNKDGCCRLINSKRTWLTARAGDAVVLKSLKSAEFEWHFIKSIALYLVHRVEYNESIVETAQSWLDCTNVIYGTRS